MDSINVGYYFNAIGEDIHYLVTGKAQDENEVITRVTSLALRILGGIFHVSATVSLVARVALAPVAPVASFFGIISAIFAAVLAHDMIRFGDNWRLQSNAEANHKKNFFGIFSSPDSLAYIGEAAAFEHNHGIPSLFRETILLTPFVKFIKSMS